ncbi:hypothetical protein NMG60_11025535 [Bertholletia excelsa]
MDLEGQNYQIHLSRAISSPNTPPPFHPSNASLTILPVAIIGILATALLLLGFCFFVTKCNLNWNPINRRGRFSFSRNDITVPVGFYSPTEQRRGLEESIIQSIPVLKFRKGENGELGERSFNQCAVCLNDFQQEENLRAIPNCSHLFHIDCIDVWLQQNENCPLCRTSISTPPQMIFRDSPDRSMGNFGDESEDFVVIELGERNSISVGSRKMKPVLSSGDESLDIRVKDDEFQVQPVRRSFSMDSAGDPRLYLAVQEIVRQSRNVNEDSSSEGCSSRVRRPFFSFGNGRGSRNAVLPLEFDP